LSQIADFADIFTGRLISEIPPALTAICNALKDKSSLVEIDLSDNAFGGRSVEPMVPFLTHNHSFQILKLTNNGLGPAGGRVIADALRENALISRKSGRKSNLRVVICGRNRLEDGSAQAWAHAFAEHGTLEDVRMPQNGIRMDGIIALAAGLKKNPGLRHIDLQDNTFTDDKKDIGVKAWAEAIPLWPELGVLNLSDCVLSSDEDHIPTLLQTIANGSNKRLHTLQLQNNNLGTTTFELLAKNVGDKLVNLVRLELQWNEVEDDDEHLENLSIALKARGGKLFVTDEDEEEEEEEEEAEEKVEEPVKPEADLKAVDKATDDLADLLAKVSVS
jgi:Ran GTPase-activating protein 1